MGIVRYLDPTNDVAFKKIFGTEKNKSILIGFLNDILGSQIDKKIKTVSFLNPQQLPNLSEQKSSILDVLCTDETGVQYIVEMQVSRVGGFEKRAQYYVAKEYAGQIDKGEVYTNLKAVIFIAILDFVMFPEKKAYKSDHAVLDKKTYERDLKDFSFTFIELPKFNKKSVKDLKNNEEKWCYFFKNSDDPEDMEKLISESDDVIKKAYEVLEAHHWTKEELRSYEQANKRIMDIKAREQYLQEVTRAEALAEGLAEGKEKGLAEGKEKGLAEGKEKGLAEGQTKERNKNITGMLKKKFKIEDIREITGASIEEIKELKKKLK